VIHYATYFDHNYLPRALVLLESLRRHSPPFTLWCLALSPQCAQALGALNAADVRVIGLADLEAADPELLATKASRTIPEYFFTLTSCWCHYLLARFPEIELLAYLDSDLCFYSSPQALFAELNGGSIGIIEHRTGRPRALEAKFGRFNVGLLMFRNDTPGRACVNRWREQCIDWCFDRVEPSRYADQKYLDEWPGRHAETRILRHPGANVGPWNVGRHHFRGTLPDVQVDGQPLIFFHFQRIRQGPSGIIDLGLAPYWVPLSKRRWLRDHLYNDYLHRLRDAAQTAAPLIKSNAILRTSRRDEGTRPPMRVRVTTALTDATRRVWQRGYDAWFLWSGSGVRSQPVPPNLSSS
jgi:hypothetical protein